MGAIERVLIEGDLSGLSVEQRVAYYNKVCTSLSLNPLTRPFDYLKLNGKTVLYAKRDCTDQLRKTHRISITIVSRERIEDVYIVTARASTPDGRCDESTGAVTIASLKGENLSNALMKAETKAKRRVTLSIVGLGLLDETEIDSIRGARTVTVDGEIVEPQRAKALAASPKPPSAEELAAHDSPDGDSYMAPEHAGPAERAVEQAMVEAEQLAGDFAARLEQASTSAVLAGVVGDIVKAQHEKRITKAQRDALTTIYRAAQTRVAAA